MRTKILLLLPTLLFVASCGESKPTVPSIPETPVEPELTEEEKFEKFRKDILALGSGASKCEATVNQTDGYGDITIEALQTSTTTLYSNDFKREEFESKMGVEIMTGVKETGIIESDTKRLYQICDFSEDDTNDSVAYMNYSDELRDINLDVGFSFLMNTSVFLPYDQSKDVTNLTYSFSYNFTQDNIDLSKDGEVLLAFESVSKQGTTEFERYQFQSTITILNGKITKANLVMKDSLMSDANYRYLEGEYIYSYDKLEEYAGTRLDPSKYKEPSQQQPEA